MIRLYTDASVKDGVGAWAFVLIVPGVDPIEAAGVFRDGIGCSATAEARAVANALHKPARSGHAQAGTRVELFCDNRAVVDRIEYRLTSRPESPAAKAVKVVRRLAGEHRLTIRAVWIKGHRPDESDDHARHNNRADRLCREARTGAKGKRPAPRVNKARRALDVARALEGRT